MSYQVFISAGTPANRTQEEYLEAVIAVVRAAGLEPRRMDDNDFDYKNPIRSVSRVMEVCHGAIIVAYERYRIASGIELRTGTETDIAPVAFPTAWNQIEAAMAYERGLPILVVAQKGLKKDAFFEPTNDIQPFWSDLAVTEVISSRFRAVVESWARDVRDLAERAVVENTRGASSRELEAARVDALATSGVSRQLFAGSVSLITVLATTIGLLILAAKSVPDYFLQILFVVVPLLILGLAFVARVSGLIEGGQMISLFRLARRTEGKDSDD